jgi:NAD(P)-dependent dehydrogenase (short-subunit alcohol dehydrogenase family)
MAKAPRSLAGKVVAITGGGRGIGRATAAALIAQGARVAIGDVESELAAQTATELGAGTIGLPLDVTDPDSFEGFLVAAEQQLGPLDVLVNNAGIMPLGPFVAETEATSHRLVDVNLNGVLTGSRLALKRFLPRGRGHLVNIASVAGKAGFPGGVTYCATKHAVVGCSEAIIAETRGSGVDVSIVMPTVVNTELGSGLPKTRGLRFAEADDVAGAIVDALQTGRVEVWVPRELGPLIRSKAFVSRRMAAFVLRAIKADQVLAHPDHAARAAYEARMSAGGAQGDASATPADASSAEPAREPTAA